MGEIIAQKLRSRGCRIAAVYGVSLYMSLYMYGLQQISLMLPFSVFVGTKLHFIIQVGNFAIAYYQESKLLPSYHQNCQSDSLFFRWVCMDTHKASIRNIIKFT